MPENDARPSADELMNQLVADLSEGRITLDQMRERLKTDAERPIDADMLRAYCDAYEQRLLAYSAMLQTVIEIATDQRDPDAWRRRERGVDEHVVRMTDKLPLWDEQLITVAEFLTELRAGSAHGPVRLDDVSHATAHLLAHHVTGMAAQAWQSCKDIAHRSRTDSNYLYTISASELFFNAHVKTLPKPNDLMALLQLERATAIKALRDGQAPQKANAAYEANGVTIQTESVNVQGQSVSVAAEQIALNAAMRAEDGTKRSKVSVADVAVQLERYRAAGGPYLDQRTFSRLCDCQPSTVNKAIRKTTALRAWKDASLQARKQQAAPRRDSGDFVIVLDQVAAKSDQPMIADDVDVIMEKLRRQAAGNAEWLRTLEGMSSDEQARIAQLYADADYEPSPLEEDAPGRQAPKTKYRGRV